MGYRLGVDVGGTFTDVLLIDEDTGTTNRAKTASTPHDQSVGVLNGIGKVFRQAGVDPAQISQVLHGTTVATNAILEGRGARVGLVTTAGFRQILQIARSYVPGGLAGWIIWPKPEPLARLEHTVEVTERIGADGAVVTPLDEDGARAALRRLAGAGIEALTISLINSYANDAHERRLAQIAAEELPGIPVSRSSHVLPEMREYERTITTVANSYVQPQVARYVGNLDRSLRAERITAPLSILRSDGGLTRAAKAAEDPVALLLSGPAGGVTGAAWFAAQAGYDDFLTFDMGGTSTDVALVLGGQPRIGRETSVGDLTVRATSVDVRSIGAGGGSIAHVPPLTRALRVGPQSAGAVPGPAAYGQGGTEPTVTDANVVLGNLPSDLAGGEITLDVDASHKAVATIAEAMGLPSVQAAAAGIIDIVNENMFGALRLVSVRQGFDPRDFALVAFGGAGPLHANALGRLTGAWPVIVPPSPGVLCAYGDATTCARDEAARTMVRRFSTIDGAELRAVLDELAGQAAERLAAEGVPADQQTARYEVDVRYHGQGFEIPVVLTEQMLAAEDLPGVLGEAFDAEHQRLFSFLLSNEREVINLRVMVSGPPPKVEW
ncbi:MAG TPA: hydantoinase/oxoprolinase family protein, partial [Mycobacteriales bacterium]